jgi:hypothetical protein
MAKTRSCYSAAIRVRASRGDMIITPSTTFSVRRSVSPVTTMSALPATAASSTLSSSGSRARESHGGLDDGGHIGDKLHALSNAVRPRTHYDSQAQATCQAGRGTQRKSKPDIYRSRYAPVWSRDTMGLGDTRCRPRIADREVRAA